MNPTPIARRYLALLTLAIALGAAGLPVAAADWARWLGPSQDGRTTGLTELSGEHVGLELAWKRTLGLGYSGIAVVGGRAVTMFGDGEKDWVIAVDARTGDEIWRYEIGPMYPSLGGSEGGPSGMPVVADGVVYGLGAKGHLFAVSLDAGKELWSLRIDEQLGARPAMFGFASVPLVAGNLVFVETGGDAGKSLTAFDRKTGAVVWSKGDDRVGYQSPILATLGGREQIVAVTNSAALGLVPATGEVLWRHEFGGETQDDGSASPVFIGEDRFLLTGQNDSTAYGVRLSNGKWEVTKLWTSTSLKRSLATPVLHDGHLYGFDGDFLTCVNPADGEKVWKSRPPGGRGLVLVDGHLIVHANDGSVVVAEATPKGYEEKTRLAVTETGTYTYPSFADGRIFVRNTKEFAAVTVKAGAAPMPTAATTVAAPRNAFERFVRQVETTSGSRRLLVDDFMVSQPRFPIVEDDRWVHFVYRGESDDVAVTGSMTEWQVEEPLVKIEGTDLFHRSFEIAPGARWEYRFNVGYENVQPDPLNPRRLPGRGGDWSEVTAGKATRPEWMRPFAGDRRGRVDRFELKSSILDNTRPIDVYLPAGYDGGSQRYPLVLVSDGEPWVQMGHLPNALDHLVGSKLTPQIFAFVHLPPRDQSEAGGPKTEDHVRMLIEELIPKLDATYRTKADSASRTVMGSGSAALLAALAAVTHPETFGRTIALSPYLNAPAGEKLIAAIESFPAGKSKPTFHVGWNRYDLRRTEWALDLAKDGQRLTDLLKKGGFEVKGGEALDSSGWGGWPARAIEALQATAPR